jgi:hypothetical protein
VGVCGHGFEVLIVTGRISCDLNEISVWWAFGGLLAIYWSPQSYSLVSIDFKKMFLDCVIGRRGITIQLPPSSLAKNIFLKSILAGIEQYRIVLNSGPGRVDAVGDFLRRH